MIKILNITLFLFILLNGTVLKSEVTLQKKPPKVYQSLGKELVLVKENCIIYKNKALIPGIIQQTCQTYIKDVDKAFQFGYTLDKHIDSHTINKTALGHYLHILRNLDEYKKRLIRTIEKEIYNARKSNNVEYYNQLLSGKGFRLYPEDYTFMKRHNQEMKDNQYYIKFKIMLAKKIEENKRREKAEYLKKKKEQYEQQKRILLEKERKKRIASLKQKIENFGCKELYGDIVQRLNNNMGYEFIIASNHKHILFKTLTIEYTRKGFTTIFVDNNYGEKQIKTIDGFFQNWKVYTQCLGYRRWRKLKYELYELEAK